MASSSQAKKKDEKVTTANPSSTPPATLSSPADSPLPLDEASFDCGECRASYFLACLPGVVVVVVRPI